MSKKLSAEDYSKTASYKFKTWLAGTTDPYINNVEMHRHTEEELLNNKKEASQKDYSKDFMDYVTELDYDASRNVKLKHFDAFYKVFSVIFCIILIAFLLIGVASLPTIGKADAPVNNEVSQRYIEKGMEETGAVNAVTGMILDYRAFDTLGESHVLFVATCTVIILLGTSKNKEARSEEFDRVYEPKNDVIIQTMAKILVPVVMIFGIYIILTGHLGPGGGFSGGAICGAGLILYLNAFGFKKTEEFFTGKTYKGMCVGALGCYALCKTYSFYTGANEIHSIIPMGTVGNILSSGLILILNICVGIVVTGTMYTFYVMFRKGGY